MPLPLYELVDPDSPCGYPFLACDAEREIMLCICRSHFSILTPVHEEARGWLDGYARSGDTVDFEARSMADGLMPALGADGVDVTAYLKRGSVRELTLWIPNGEKGHAVELRLQRGRWVWVGLLSRKTTPPGPGHYSLINSMVKSFAPMIEVARRCPREKTKRRKAVEPLRGTCVVGAEGEIILPLTMRERLGIVTGSAVEVRMDASRELRVTVGRSGTGAGSAKVTA